MNIAEAKVQLINTIKAYSVRDRFGNFLLPPEDQRPLFLMGSPGIGKTAIVRQVAEELGIGLVSYSITHHPGSRRWDSRRSFTRPMRAMNMTCPNTL